MPFDSLNYLGPNAEEIRILDAMAERLATPDTWCQGTLVDRDGLEPAFCLVGALRVVQSARPNVLARRYSAAGKRVAAMLRQQTGCPVMWFNDFSSHAGVLALIAKARAAFVQEMSDAV